MRNSPRSSTLASASLGLAPSFEVDRRSTALTRSTSSRCENGCLTDYMVLTMFGQVLYAACNSSAVPRRALDEIAADREGIIASNDKRFGRLRTLCNGAEVIGNQRTVRVRLTNDIGAVATGRGAPSTAEFREHR